MNLADRLRDLEDGLDRLRRAAVGACVVIEGGKDVAALEALGVGGAHRPLNRGVAIEVFIDDLVHEAKRAGWPRVVLLTDWDRTGGRLHHRLRSGLAGRVPLDEECRRRIAIAARCNCVEELPSDLSSLRQQTV